jgi:hypothetical protein
MYALAAYQLGQEIAVNYKKPALAHKSDKPVVADK